ncbi:metallophosphoesterase [Dactylosporangium roseum]|uniref:Metallophosphoesterase n=1 Tax=Dactylosporangium roseum TaxID=47989 RepID=A0ABY5YWE5_9ACTN|nr:metallophosphoesterase [Dactylosporangium roseum]UWZ33724.1 metallophosphoesterase [Dactylosporangium roseum]
MATTEAAVPAPRRSSLIRPLAFGLALTTVLALLFGVPWWSLVLSGNRWPAPVAAIGTVLFVAAAVSFPVLMVLGHGRRLDWAARIADTLLGAVWILFVWALAGDLLRLAMLAGGVDDPLRSRITAAFTAVVAAGIGLWGYVEAMRIPRVRRVTVTVPRLGAGLDGLRVVLLTDTHYGPINRARWSRGVTEVVNSLDADIVAHTGDIADGTVARRTEQAAPLGDVRARMARVYVTGNHEYFGEAQGWLDHMRCLGWEPLHNRHLIVSRDGSELVVAGVDDRTAAGAGLAGHRADHATALAGADPALPVLLLAHQPKQIDAAVAHGIDLQLSGHTHGGQIWPFHYLVRLDQPVVQGLTRHGSRTQLFTSRGTGFWGPPFRVFAPSEITELTLRSAGQPAADVDAAGTS